jgi:hypothetical protein
MVCVGEMWRKGMVENQPRQPLTLISSALLFILRNPPHFVTSSHRPIATLSHRTASTPTAQHGADSDIYHFVGLPHRGRDEACA